MLKLRDIEAEMAKALGVPTLSIVHIADNLKAAGNDLWPSPGSGRFRRVKVSASQLVNLTLARVGDVPVKSAERVAFLRSLRITSLFQDGDTKYCGGEPYTPITAGGLVLCELLGDTLDAWAADKNLVRIPLRYFSVEITPDEETTVATINISAEGVFTKAFFSSTHLLSEEDWERLSESGETTFSWTAMLNHGLFYKIAQIAAAASADAVLPLSGPNGPETTPPSDSRSSSTVAPATADLGNTKAAEVPPSTALVSAQPAHPQAAPRCKAHPTGQEARKQFLAVRADLVPSQPPRPPPPGILSVGVEDAAQRKSEAHQRLAA